MLEQTVGKGDKKQQSQSFILHLGEFCFSSLFPPCAAKERFTLIRNILSSAGEESEKRRLQATKFPIFAPSAVVHLPDGIRWDLIPLHLQKSLC